MTKRLYYDDSYLTRFEGRVLEQFPSRGHFAVVLNQTAFYPTSGGQPYDQGTLGGQNVVDVLVRESDDVVLHLLEVPLDNPSAPVIGEIDWDRRFDHMQQHSGQHILSQAFLQVAQAETVSFHLGAESATIDLVSPQPLSQEDMEQAELLTNQVIWDDRPIKVRTVKAAELPDFPLRKPPVVEGDVRLVQVLDFDWSACGGTHVSRTGEIGLCKVIKWERRGEEMRVEFRCGRRALVDYAQKNSMVNSVSAGFNVGHWELDQAVARTVDENKELRSQLRQAGRKLARYSAEELRASAPSVAGVRLVVHNLNQDSVLDIRELARSLVSDQGVVALLGTGDQKARFCFARSSDVDIDMVSLVRAAAVKLGSRGGGGQVDFAQGGGPLEHEGQLDTVLEWAAQRIQTSLKRAG
jgi:alanyl-tRNA synthetase